MFSLTEQRSHIPKIYINLSTVFQVKKDWIKYSGRKSHKKRASPIMAEALIVFWRRHPDLNWRIAALQAVALPLGYAAKKNGAGNEI